MILEERLRNSCSNVYQMYLKVVFKYITRYWEILNDSWIWYDLWFVCHNLHFWICVLRVIYFLTFISQTGSLSPVSDKVLRAKWPHWPYGIIIFSAISAIQNIFYYQNFDFQAPTPFAFSQSSHFILQKVCFQYVQ